MKQSQQEYQETKSTVEKDGPMAELLSFFEKWRTTHDRAAILFAEGSDGVVGHSYASNKFMGMTGRAIASQLPLLAASVVATVGGMMIVDATRKEVSEIEADNG